MNECQVVTLNYRDLPTNWRWVRLGEVCRVASGGTPSTHIPDFWDGDIPWVTPTDLGKQKETTLIRTARQISSAGLESSSAEIVPIGTILMSSRAPIGHLAVAGVACCTNQGCKNLIPREQVDSQFLYFALKKAVPDLKALGSGATFAEISKSIIEGYKIPLPPLQEQKRIAAILTQQMAAIDKARASAEAQLEAAKVLPAAYLRDLYDGPEAQMWPKVALGELLSLRKEVVYPKDNPVGTATFVGLEHIESHTGLRFGCVDLDLSQLTGRKPRFKAGDIVYGYLRPYLNKVWVAEIDGICSVDQYVYSVRQEKADTEFIAAFMRSPVYLERAPIQTTPGQLPRIRTEEVAIVKIGLPSLSEQHRIAMILAEKLSVADQAQKGAKSTLKTINKLPSALLRRAFNGEI
jgi:type I restriction enzyme S subunit